MSILWILAGACGHPPPPPPPDDALAAVIDGRATDPQVEAYEAILADREPHAGPQHEEIFRAWSPDGFHVDLSGKVLVREHAAVPEVLVGPDGRTYLFHVEGDLDRGRALARAHDAWMRTHGLLGFGAIDLLAGQGGPPFVPEPGFVVHGMVQGMVVDPTVRPLPDGRWRLYYIGVPLQDMLAPGAWDDGADHIVWSAVSEDLLVWTQEGEVVRGPNADPAVWCDGDWCLMVSTGLDRSISADGGRTFRFEGSFGVPGFAPSFVDLPDGRVRLFYNTKDRGGALRSMISVDRGRSWDPEPGDRVPAYTLEAPSFLPAEGGGWWVYYHYWKEGITPDMWENGFRRKEPGEEDAPTRPAAQEARPEGAPPDGSGPPPGGPGMGPPPGAPGMGPPPGGPGMGPPPGGPGMGPPPGGPGSGQPPGGPGSGQPAERR